jgi:hypothetical protein
MSRSASPMSGRVGGMLGTRARLGRTPCHSSGDHTLCKVMRSVYSESVGICPPVSSFSLERWSCCENRYACWDGELGKLILGQIRLVGDDDSFRAFQSKADLWQVNLDLGRMMCQGLPGWTAIVKPPKDNQPPRQAGSDARRFLNAFPAIFDTPLTLIRHLEV